MSDTVRPDAADNCARDSSDLARALSFAVMEDLGRTNHDVRPLIELVGVLRELHGLGEQLQRQETSGSSHTDLTEKIDRYNAERVRLIDRFDQPLRNNGANGNARVYSETPGEICERLIGHTLIIDDELPLQSDVNTADDHRIAHMEKVDEVRTGRIHLQECLKQALQDIGDGNAILPPKASVKKYENPYLDPVSRKEVPFDIYEYATKATNLKPDIRHILAMASTGHGASISYIGRDGTLRSSVFDRWAGTKYTLLMGQKENDEVLQGGSPIGEELRDLLIYSYGRFPPYQVFETAFADWLDWLLSGLDVRPEDIDLFISSESLFVTTFFSLANDLNRWLPNAQIITDLEHHAIHQRQAFWASGFDEAAVLTLDTCGERLARLGDHKICGTISRMDRSGKCDVLREMIFPHSSAGLIYSIVNHHIGFTQGEEGKTMGLAPYGRPDLYRELVKHLRLYDDGSFDFLAYRELHAALEAYEKERPRTWTAEFTQKHSDIAFAGQALIEDIVTNCFRAALRLSGLSRLVYAGGIALNSVANEVANRAAKPAELYIPPNPSDAGLALGCAFYAAYELAGWDPPEIETPEYLGPNYDDEAFAKAAQSTKFHSYRLELPEAVTAQCIANGHIVARYFGEAEYGPRALGNRSIVADPRRHDMKDFLNQRVKHREGYRPYAPSVLLEHASEWFDLDDRSPYMLRVVDVPEQLRDRIPAVVHVDGTARVQTVDRNENESYWKLIDEFRKLTGVALVLNTSFNIAGKPIVETPQDAVKCFDGTEIDVLLLGDWVLSKRPLEEFTNAAREPGLEVNPENHSG